MRIKRVNYMIQKQDYWVNMRVPRNRSDLDEEEMRVVRNQVEFNKLTHKM